MGAPIALTWIDHRRTTELADGLGIGLAVIVTRHRGLRRYLELTVRTVRELSRRKPTAMIVQSPSIILVALCVVLRPFLRFKLIVDAHNEAVEPVIHRQWWAVRLARWLLRKADLTIVTNRFLADKVVAAGGRPFVLPDRIPQSPPTERIPLPDGFNVAVIATFAPDEPVAAIFSALTGLPMTAHVTGNHLKLNEQVRASAPPNVKFTGFLPEERYWALLSSVDAIVDLSTMDNCLVCGAYEGMALGKPLLLSGNPASVELFAEAAVHVDNSVGDIRRGLIELQQQHVELNRRSAGRRGVLDNSWRAQALELQRHLGA